METERQEGPKKYTRAEIQAFLADIAERVVDSDPAILHSVIALNHLLRQPEAKELFDDDIREQLADLWLKIKASGLHLDNPPLLFEAPEASDDESLDSEIVDDSEEIPTLKRISSQDPRDKDAQGEEEEEDEDDEDLEDFEGEEEEVDEEEEES